jgi:hypothetical protein
LLAFSFAALIMPASNDSRRALNVVVVDAVLCRGNAEAGEWRPHRSNPEANAALRNISVPFQQTRRRTNRARSRRS